MNLSFKMRFFLLIFWTLFTFVLLTIPMPVSDGSEVSYIDKFVHFILFGCFSFLLSNYFIAKKTSYTIERIIIASFVTSFFYAIMMELIQSYIPSRTRSIYDLLFGLFGIIIFTFVFYGTSKKR
jgi:VanZ family protein